jgi:hypothetical protein
MKGISSMKKVLYIPLDERACNYANIIRMFRAIDDVCLIYPERCLLPNKKEPANINAMWEFVKHNIKDCEYAVLSIEMLFYGGLLPSRIHNKRDEQEITEFAEKLRTLKEENLECKIFVSSLIMRTPRYSSSEQEPEYYEIYGERIFKFGVLKDKSNRGIITEEEQQEYCKLKSEIPLEIIHDFESRRAFNRNVISEVVQLLKEGVFEFLVIPQDDSYPYGYTSIDQQHIYSLVKKENLNNQILMYPGADEFGYTLTARVVNQVRGLTPNIFVFYSSVSGEFVVPKYEDRVIGESLKSHVLAVGGRLTNNPDSADIILAYNTPAKEMIEASGQFEHNIHYDRERNLAYFVNEIVYYLNKNRYMAVCDCAYANGGDFQLLNMLNAETKLVPNIKSYHAWNTNCNTLGSTLSESCIFLQASEHKVKENLISSIFEDVFYEGKIRKEFIDEYLPEHEEVSYFNIQKRITEITEITHRRVLALYDSVLSNNNGLKIERVSIGFPWNRLFNGDFQVTLKDK